MLFLRLHSGAWILTLWMKPTFRSFTLWWLILQLYGNNWLPLPISLFFNAPSTCIKAGTSTIYLLTQIPASPDACIINSFQCWATFKEHCLMVRTKPIQLDCDIMMFSQNTLFKKSNVFWAKKRFKKYKITAATLQASLLQFLDILRVSGDSVPFSHIEDFYLYTARFCKVL